MAILTVKEMTGVGVAAGLAAAAAGGDSFPVSTDQRTFLHVKNGGAAITVTIPAQTVAEKVPGAGSLTVPALGGVVPATTGDVYFGPFPRDYIGANGQVQVTYSAVASVTVEAVHLGKAD